METAHIWCSGAEYNSWEDWLNETTAEWASLLFALNQKNIALFDFILDPKIRRHNSYPSIRTPDGSRPEGVHDKGTVLFYEIYKTFGVGAVRLLVRIFADLGSKNTSSLLQKLYSIGQNSVANFIDQRLN